MKNTLSDFDPLFQESSKQIFKNNEKRKELNDQFKLLFSQLQEHNMLEPNPLVHAALSVINTASDLITGLEGEIEIRKTELEKGENQNIVKLNLLEKKHKLLEKTAAVVQKQTVKLKTNKSSRKKAGDATAKRYEHITNVAIEITKNYAQKYPYRLSETTCEHGVKANIDKEILERMSNQAEYRLANLTNPPDIRTVGKHRKKAFEKLGYQVKKSTGSRAIN